MSSRHRRTLEAVFENPVRANIQWDDAMAMLRHYGAAISERAGSRVAVLLRDRVVVLHRPHPQKETSRAAIRDLREFLIDTGLIP